MRFALSGVSPSAHVTVQQVDDTHGNVLKRYAAMGSPLDPTPVQVEQLNLGTAPCPEPLQLSNGKLELSLAENALVLLKIED
jgi:xylan 1,4-beta-xylosidase